MLEFLFFVFPYPNHHVSYSPYFRRHPINHWVPSFPGPQVFPIRNELEVSQDSIAFRERSYKRTINILRRSSSKAFFLRSATLGIKELYITYRILHRKCLQLVVNTRSVIINFRIFSRPLTCISFDHKYALYYSSFRFKAQMKWPNFRKGAFIRLTLSGRGIHRIIIMIIIIIIIIIITV